MRLFCWWLLAGMVGVASSAHAAGPGLLDIYSLASKNDPEYRAAAANFRATGELRWQSIGAVLPSLSATGEAAKNVEDVKTTGIGIPGETRFDSNTYTFTLRQPLFRMDLFTRFGQSSARVSQAEAEYKAAEQALIVNVAERYFDLLAAQDNLDFARAEKSATEQQLKQVRARHAVGVATVADLREVEASYDLSTAQEISAEARVGAAEEALRERTGDYHRSLRRLRAEIPLVAPTGSVEDWTRLAETRNFRLRAARNAAQAANSEISRQSAGHYPMLDIVAKQSGTETGGRFGDSEIENRAVGLQLTVPLFEGGQVLSRTREARERHIEATEREEKQRRAVVRAATDAYRNTFSSMSRVQALARSVTSTEAALKAVNAGYQAGVRTAVDVLDAQRTHLRARRDHSIERYQYIVTSLRLKEAGGALSRTDLETLTGWFE